MTSLSSAHIILQLNSDNAGEGSHPRDPLLTTVEGERFEEAACREMFEETGVRIENPGPQVARRVTTFRWIDGELVEADERFFLIRIKSRWQVSDQGWTDLERRVVKRIRWWSRANLSPQTNKSFRRIWRRF
jgi:hypothetical protein